MEMKLVEIVEKTELQAREHTQDMEERAVRMN